MELEVAALDVTDGGIQPSPGQSVCNFPVQGSLTSEQIQRLPPIALAYLGDAVYELFIRTHYLMPPKRIGVYHNQVVAQVRAESQAKQLRFLELQLTPTEKDILKRGRNAASKGPKRVDGETYRQATGLETLFGYLYLVDPQRLTQLLTQLELEINP